MVPYPFYVEHLNIGKKVTNIKMSLKAIEKEAEGKDVGTLSEALDKALAQGFEVRMGSGKHSFMLKIVKDEKTRTIWIPKPKNEPNERSITIYLNFLIEQSCS